MSHDFDIVNQEHAALAPSKIPFLPVLLGWPQSLLPAVGHRHQLHGVVRETLVLGTSQAALLKIGRSRAHLGCP